MIRLAAKLLSPVEVSADASNQHEFHADTLRRVLGFSERRVRGVIDLTYLTDAADEPLEESCNFTLYNAREGKPRPPEYRLYFDSIDLQKRATPGDILILTREQEKTNLAAVIIPRRSELGESIARILMGHGFELDQRFREVKSALQAADLAQLIELTRERATVLDADSLLNQVDKAFINEVLHTGRLPTTARMAEHAARAVARALGTSLDPDQFLFWCLEAETALFKYLEERIGQRLFDELSSRGPVSFVEATELVLRQLQARRSRRGHSLQNHFAALLRTEKIPFDAQCIVEGGEKPDFIIPGCAEYSDPRWPSGRLRMVACKATIKERWGQILKEADRIPEKYLLTMDVELTDDAMGRMRASGMRLFMPVSLHDAYRDRGAPIETADALLNALREALQ